MSGISTCFIPTAGAFVIAVAFSIVVVSGITAGISITVSGITAGISITVSGISVVAGNITAAVIRHLCSQSGIKI